MLLDKLNRYYLLNDTHTENGPKKNANPDDSSYFKIGTFQRFEARLREKFSLTALWRQP